MGAGPPLISKKRVVIIPGMGCVPAMKCHWYPWLLSELGKLGVECIVQDFPDPHECHEQRWLAFMREELKVDERCICVGHRYLLLNRPRLHAGDDAD